MRKITDKLFALLEANKQYGKEKKKRPPSVEFCWGRDWTFPAVIESLTVGYSLFKPDGTPIRASAKLSLTQVEKAVAKPASGGAKKKGQNPTTRGMADLRSHTVRDGDSLPSISFASYGDPTLWRTIAEANGVDDPLALRRGRVARRPAGGRVISGIEVKVDGAPLDATLAEPRHRGARRAPLRAAGLVRRPHLRPGARADGQEPAQARRGGGDPLHSPDGGALAPLIAGQVLAVEPDFSVGHMILAARGYDHAHALQRTGNAETYQNMTIGDIVKKVAQRAGFQVGEIEDGGGGVLDFIQQSQETDWAFLWRLARRIDCKVVVEKKTLHFRKLGEQGRDGRAASGARA